MRREGRLGVACAIVAASLFYVIVAVAQGKGSTSGGGPPASSAAATAGLQGLSYAKPQWPKYLGHAPTDGNAVILCYELVYTNSSSQPFILEPRSDISYHSSGGRVPCAKLNADQILKMDQLLSIAIDAQNIDIGQLRVLNISATDVQGTSINPTPIRPSFGATSTSTNLAGEQVYFLTWPNRLAGDVIRTISINAIFTPGPSAQLWKAHTFYPAGSVVSSAKALAAGQYFLTVDGGVSGVTEPGFGAAPPSPTVDGPLTWQFIGATAPPGNPAKAWAAGHPFTAGDVIFVPTNASYYLLTTVSGGAATGNSGAVMPSFSIPGPAPAIREETPPPPKTPEGGIQWQPNGATQSGCSNTTPNKAWAANTTYAAGSVICDIVDGLQYAALSTGTSGATKPLFVKAMTNEYMVAWTPIGTTLPSWVTAGQIADQTVNLLTMPLPQSHSKSYFNLAAGVVFSTVARPTFVVPTGLTGTNTTAAQVRTSNNPTIEPVLLLTFYPVPMDAERRCTPVACLVSDVPGLILGLSLSSPTTSYYVGVSADVVRNVEIVVGDNLQLVSAQPSPAVAISNTATTVVTRQVFTNGFFAGLTFNVSGFIQGLVSGGGGGSGAAAATPKGS